MSILFQSDSIGIGLGRSLMTVGQREGADWIFALSKGKEWIPFRPVGVAELDQIQKVKLSPTVAACYRLPSELPA